MAQKAPEAKTYCNIIIFVDLFVAKFVGSTQSGPVEVLNLTRTSQGRIGLLIREGKDQKIYVEDVVPGEPAATQGDLRQGDRILEACNYRMILIYVDGL